MSDNWIKLVPTDPHFVPSDQAAEAAEQYFNDIAPDVEEIKLQTSSKIRFFDNGANFERVSCPSCDSQLPIEWWQEHLDRDIENGFKLDKYKLPCCNVEHDLNELKYDWAQAFGRFALEAMNPNIGQLTKANVAEFEQILGSSLRVVYQHI